MKPRLSKNAWGCDGEQRNRTIRDHSQCNRRSAKQALVDAGVLPEVSPAWKTIHRRTTKTGQRMERLLEDDVDLLEESPEQRRIKISIADALNTLNRIATKVDAMLAKQIEHYRDILQANQKQGISRTPRRTAKIEKSR